MTRVVVALYRSPAYSPNRHLENDRAIMDAVLERLAAAGWQVRVRGEQEVRDGPLPRGDLYLNMCQGAAASTWLRDALPPGVPCINSPDAVLACHRHRLVPLLHGAGLPFPATVLVATGGPEAGAPPVHLVADNGHPVWIKRGDVHAQSTADVLSVPPQAVGAALARFADRGIERVALQAHVPGPVVKFYGVTRRGFFHWYPADPAQRPDASADAGRLRTIAERAARALGLAVYGGDAVFAAPDHPVLIDVNDWPSFAPVRARAAGAIARYAERRAREPRYACSIP
jgi:hypothetical protein